MARFKRRVAYRRRKPVRARRRRAVRRYRKPRAKPGSMYCKLTRIASFSVQNDANEVYYVRCKLEDFPEWKNMAAVFERTKVLKMVGRVMPLQNVANNSTSTVPAYVMFPWHKGDFAKANDFNSMLSIDKHKLRRQTQMCSQTYVPSTLLDGYVSGTTGSYSTVCWRPTINNTQGGGTQLIYGGCVGFQGDSSMEGRQTHFNIIIDLYVKMIEQENLTG